MFEQFSSTLFTENGDSTRLPLLISVPHGGHTIPASLLKHTCLTRRDIFPDSDPFTRRIYYFQDEVQYYHDTHIARAIVDLNRHENDLPPANPDGVLKSQTLMGAQVYRSKYFTNSHLAGSILEQYYHPYHKKIAADAADPILLCGLDCHSMLEFPPGREPCRENERPFICLSNCGDESGESDGSHLSCSPELIRLLAECFRTVFPDESDNITLNTPFKGGHITRFHSTTIPWIQIELNRRAYLHPQWFDNDSLQVDSRRIAYLRNKFLQAFITFCEEAIGIKQFPQNYSELHQPAASPLYSFNSSPTQTSQ